MSRLTASSTAQPAAWVAAWDPSTPTTTVGALSIAGFLRRPEGVRSSVRNPSRYCREPAHTQGRWVYNRVPLVPINRQNLTVCARDGCRVLPSRLSRRVVPPMTGTRPPISLKRSVSLAPLPSYRRSLTGSLGPNEFGRFAQPGSGLPTLPGPASRPGSGSGMSGLPGIPAGTASRAAGVVPRYGVRITVMARPPAAG
ncbi:MAG: PE/PPE C-terminal domain-containing protein [Mycobacterium sp.]